MGSVKELIEAGGVIDDIAGGEGNAKRLLRRMIVGKEEDLGQGSAYDLNKRSKQGLL
jgi:hypothetical protein